MNNLNKAGNYLDTGIGIIFVLLRRRIVDGKTRGFRVRHEPRFTLIVQERNKAAIFYLNATNTSEWQRERAL